MKEKMNRVATALILVLGILLTACSGGNPDEGVAPEILAIGSPSEGEKLFNSGGASGVPCASCHTLDGTVLVGPSLQGLSNRAGTRVEGQDAETYLRNSILNPAEYLVPDFQNLMNTTYPTTLDEEDIDNLVAYLLTLE